LTLRAAYASANGGAAVCAASAKHRTHRAGSRMNWSGRISRNVACTLIGVMKQPISPMSW
jgi:hypothetical protein